MHFLRRIAGLPAPVKLSLTLIVVHLAFTMSAHTTFAGAGDPPPAGLPDTEEQQAAIGRRTLFGVPLKDVSNEAAHLYSGPTSQYGQGWFPETLRAPEMDLEFKEGRLDWFHAEKSGHYQDEVKAEGERSFGSLTLEVEVPYLREQQVFRGPSGVTRHRDEGLSRVELGIRYPLFQYVSADDNIDDTLVGAFELRLPTNTPFSKDGEVSPRLYNLLRLGQHISVQTSFASASLVGPQDGGAESLEYAASFAYVFDGLHFNHILMFAPIFELVGEQALSGKMHGEKALFGTAGFHVNTESIGFFQPRIGIGYIFPMDRGARDELRWGILTSFVFEF